MKIWGGNSKFKTLFYILPSSEKRKKKPRDGWEHFREGLGVISYRVKKMWSLRIRKCTGVYRFFPLPVFTKARFPLLNLTDESLNRVDWHNMYVRYTSARAKQKLLMLMFDCIECRWIGGASQEFGLMVGSESFRPLIRIKAVGSEIQAGSSVITPRCPSSRLDTSSWEYFTLRHFSRECNRTGWGTTIPVTWSMH